MVSKLSALKNLIKNITNIYIYMAKQTRKKKELKQKDKLEI
jgi:hypothetical protein